MQIALGENLTALRCLQAAAQLAALVAFALSSSAKSRPVVAGTMTVICDGDLRKLGIYDRPSAWESCSGARHLGAFGLLCAPLCGASTEGWSGDWWLAALFSLLNILTWELALPFCFLACCLLLLGRAPWRFRWLRAIAAGLAPLFLTAVGLWLKRTSLYSGTTLGSLKPGVLWSTSRTGGVRRASVLSTFRSAAPLPPAGPPTRTISPRPPSDCDGGRDRNRPRPKPPKRFGAVIFCGLVLLVAPAAVISVSARYQVDTAPGLGYTETSLTYAGVSVLVAAALGLAALRRGRWRRALGSGLALVAALGFGLIAGQTLVGSARIAELITNDGAIPARCSRRGGTRCESPPRPPG